MGYFYLTNLALWYSFCGFIYIMRHPIIIMDFSGAYETQAFYKHRAFKWIDCRSIQGTKYYCDSDAEKELRSLIDPFSPYSLHFIDSGDYHYISKLWTDRILEPYTLIVFDHHPDMHPSLIGELTSCGRWVRDILQSPYSLADKVILVGVSDNLLEELSCDVSFQKRVFAFGESNFSEGRSDAEIKSAWQKFALEQISGPVYISIDKDVLRSEDAVSDWDQGSMTIDEMTFLLETIIRSHKVLGADICGECSNTLRLISDRHVTAINDRDNQALLRELYKAL